MGTHAAHRGGRRSRPRTLFAALLGTCTVGGLSAAIAFACVPATSMGFDRSPYNYQPGETVKVSAQGFHPGTAYTLTLTSPSNDETPVGVKASSGALTGPAGEISDEFTISPNAAIGDYIVKAQTKVTNSSGQTSSRVARETLSVVSAPTPPPGPPPLVAPPPGQAPILAPAVGTSIIKGTSGNDTLKGTAFADVINCGAGNDRVVAGGGNDIIRCGGGDDRVSGGAGNDKLYGGSGRDSLSGGKGKDLVSGGKGNDKLRGDAGKDRLLGGSGNDTLFRDRGDRVSGGAGRDSMVAVK